MSDLARLVIKRFPENRNMQLMCLRVASHFVCSQCRKPMRATLVAVVEEDWDRILCNRCYEDALARPPEESAEDVVPKEWLGARVSLQDAEKDNMVMDVPFGNQAQEWEDFKAAMLEGDEICEFTSPPDACEPLPGKAGYAMVRNGSVVRCIVTVTNED